MGVRCKKDVQWGEPLRSGARLFLGRRLPGVLGSLACVGGSGYWSRGRSLPRRGLYAAL